LPYNLKRTPIERENFNVRQVGNLPYN
jgi:hypothetical protein